MSLRIIVLAKQVPDTRNVGKDAMKADGTINRAALPAIFNPVATRVVRPTMPCASFFFGVMSTPTPTPP